MTFQSRIIAAGITLAGTLLAATPAQAAPMSFFVDWSGSSFNNSAEAHGILSFADAEILNAPGDQFLLPGIDVTDFSLTISGADSGNGIFSLADFSFFTWNSAGATFDFAAEFIGQATTGGAWGSDQNWVSTSGDFNIFGLGAPAPTAPMSFVLQTSDGTGNKLSLTSFRPVPVPGAVWLFGSALVGLIGFGRQRLDNAS